MNREEQIFGFESMYKPSHRQLEHLDGNSILGVESCPQTELHCSYKMDESLKKYERLLPFQLRKKNRKYLVIVPFSAMRTFKRRY